MKNKILKIVPIIFILLGILSVNIYAVTYTSTDCTVKSEGNITITVKASENLKNYDVTLTSYEGLTFVSCSSNENAAVNTSTGAISYATLGNGVTTLGTYTFKAPKVTENKTYNVVFDINGTENKAKVTVEAEKVTPSEQEKPNNTETPSTGTTTPSTPAEPEKPTTPTVTEPKFTDANKTMYSTGNINLRASWSTSSAATTIEKGTELKVTGTSTEKVNGYVWYRVNYNGATKYVASNLLTSTKPEEEKKSDNAYLKSLTVDGQELLPVFNKETTEYTMQVTSDVTELNIKAETEDEKATVEIQGNKDLKEGENTVTISVNAEDNTIKIYEIKVTKLKAVALGLKSLVIEDTNIAETFKTDIYQYEIDIKDISKLEIEAVATDEKATVEILGNEDLQDGENVITIMVSSEDRKEKVTYQITANKVIAKVEQPAQDEQQEVDTKIYFYIGIAAILLIALIIVIVYVIKNRKNEEEYDFSDNVEEDDQEFEQTKEINYNENNNIEEQVNEEKEERKAKIDYFLDTREDEEEKPKRRKGKHF